MLNDKVQCIYAFQRERRDWGHIFTYPEKDRVLTIKTATKHPIHDFDLLTFHEIHTMPLCSKRFVKLITGEEFMKNKNIAYDFSKPKGYDKFKKRYYETINV